MPRQKKDQEIIEAPKREELDEIDPNEVIVNETVAAPSEEQEPLIRPIDFRIPDEYWRQILSYDPSFVDQNRPIDILAFPDFHAATYLPPQQEPRAFTIDTDPTALYLCVCFRVGNKLMRHQIVVERELHTAGSSGEMDTGFILRATPYHRFDAHAAPFYAKRGIQLINTHFTPNEDHILHFVFQTTTQPLVFTQSLPLIRLIMY